jgi:hypothetical protein
VHADDATLANTSAAFLLVSAVARFQHMATWSTQCGSESSANWDGLSLVLQDEHSVDQQNEYRYSGFQRVGRMRRTSSFRFEWLPSQQDESRQYQDS